jgi:hypothetical protein
MLRSILARLAAISLVWFALSFAAFADSHARIVRLSSAEGRVQVDRASGSGLERAILNTPIVQGARVVTGDDGLAEIEFENQSALRLTENSEVTFTQLSLSDNGTRVSEVEVVKGLVYLDAAKGDDYRVKVGSDILLVHSNSLMRLSTTPEQAQVAVFKGEVQLENQSVSAHRKQTLLVSLSDPAKYSVENGTEAVRFDAWNQEREEYSKTYAENAGYGGPNHGYGLQDLNYYGDYFYAPGYGYAWQPFGFSGSMLGWNPYTNGAWGFYPGFGYMWASAYPWGWLPYHYGSWVFLNGHGWAWVPGRGYNGAWSTTAFAPVPRITKAPAGWTAPAPPHITAGAPASTVTVGSTNSAALTIPGGRTQPVFGSVVHGRAVAGEGFTRPTATAGQAGHAVTPHSTASGHVFQPPARPAAAGPAMGAPGASERGVAPSAHMGIGATPLGASAPVHH